MGRCEVQGPAPSLPPGGGGPFGFGEPAPRVGHPFGSRSQNRPDQQTLPTHPHAEAAFTRIRIHRSNSPSARIKARTATLTGHEPIGANIAHNTQTRTVIAPLVFPNGIHQDKVSAGIHWPDPWTAHTRENVESDFVGQCGKVIPAGERRAKNRSDEPRREVGR